MRGVERVAEIVARVDPSARIVAATSLGGGLSNRTTIVEVEFGNPPRAGRWLVRDRHGECAPGDREATASVVREAAVLVAARGWGLPVPRVVGRVDDALVLEFVDGAVRLERTFGAIAAVALADTLARIHSLPPVAGLPDRASYLCERLDDQPAVMDHAMREPEIRTAIARLGVPRAARPVVLHGDYWPGNVVWQGDELAAVIDWESAAIGDRLADVAIARLDLAFVYGFAASQAFTERYRTSRPFAEFDLVVWDLVAALRPCGVIDAWASACPALGRPDLSEERMRSIHADFTARALRRAHADAT